MCFLMILFFGKVNEGVGVPFILYETKPVVTLVLYESKPVVTLVLDEPESVVTLVLDEPESICWSLNPTCCGFAGAFSKAFAGAGWSVNLSCWIRLVT